MTAGGRPQWAPTDKDREMIRTMAAVGIPRDKICAVVRVSEKTLKRHCRSELETADAQANATVGSSLFEMATKGPASAVRLGAAMFWLRCRAGWAVEPIATGRPGLPIVSELSDEDLNRLLLMNGIDPETRQQLPSGRGAVTPGEGVGKNRRNKPMHRELCARPKVEVFSRNVFHTHRGCSIAIAAPLARRGWSAIS